MNLHAAAMMKCSVSWQLMVEKKKVAQRKRRKDGRRTSNRHQFPGQPPPRPRQQTSCSAEAGRDGGAGWGGWSWGFNANSREGEKYWTINSCSFYPLSCWFRFALCSSVFFFPPPPPPPLFCCKLFLIDCDSATPLMAAAWLSAAPCSLVPLQKCCHVFLGS